MEATWGMAREGEGKLGVSVRELAGTDGKTRGRGRTAGQRSGASRRVPRAGRGGRNSGRASARGLKVGRARTRPGVSVGRHAGKTAE